MIGINHKINHFDTQSGLVFHHLIVTILVLSDFTLTHQIIDEADSFDEVTVLLAEVQKLPL